VRQAGRRFLFPSGGLATKLRSPIGEFLLGTANQKKARPKKQIAPTWLTAVLGAAWQAIVAGSGAEASFGRGWACWIRAVIGGAFTSRGGKKKHVVEKSWRRGPRAGVALFVIFANRVAGV